MYCLLRLCCERAWRIISKIRFRYVCLSICVVMLLNFFGVFTHLFEIPYDERFSYPYEGDIRQFVDALRHNEKPVVDPINEYNYTFILNNKQKCIDVGYDTFRVIYIVKSAIEHIDRRLAIRNSWGFERRFFDVPSRTVFLLGVHPHDEELQAKIKIEAMKHKDIIQADFIDSYYNNTIKTMMGFKWIVKHCSNSKFYMFVDDDMYVSVKNVLTFIRYPTNYPEYLKEPRKLDKKREIKASDLLYISNLANKSAETSNANIMKTEDVYKISTMQDDRESTPSNTVLKREKRQVFDFQLPDNVRLFAGYVIISSPHRHRSSKWYVSLKEYPYHLWPPYITAGAYILSKEALLDMYYASFYTKHFRFDDIFLGLVAKKADIEPFHCEEFHFYKKEYTRHNYKYVITSHGYGNPDELLRVWNEQKALGNA